MRVCAYSCCCTDERRILNNGVLTSEQQQHQQQAESETCNDALNRALRYSKRTKRKENKRKDVTQRITAITVNQLELKETQLGEITVSIFFFCYIKV